MDIEFLKTEILPTREKEIQEGKNLGTAQPIYVVLDAMENVFSGHTEFSPITNHRSLPVELGYLDMSLDCEEREFCESENDMKEPEMVTKFYTDRVAAFFLTSEAAHDYLKYQSHNLRKPCVYVFHSGYRNWEMDNLLKGA